MTERLDHLDPATIAALVDQTLDPAARAAAEAHLAACADCREVWVETSEITGDTQGATAGETSRGATVVARPAQRRWMYGAMGIAAALIVGVSSWLMLRPDEVERALAELQADDSVTRFAAGRLSVAYPYLPPADVQRGNDLPDPPVSVQRAALLLQEGASAGTARSLHAAGLSHLATGDAPAAVELLSAASVAAPQDARIRSDLAAALLEKWRASGDTTDAARALDEAKRAALIAPRDAAAQFNVALAFDALGLSTQARRAFQEYLRLDTDSPWAREVRERLERLEAADSGDTTSRSSLSLDMETKRLPAAMDGDRTTPAVRDCAAAAALALRNWAAAFEAGRSEDGLFHAQSARRQLQCAGMPVLEATSREATSLLELNRISEADALAAEILAVPPAMQFHRARARAFQVRGLLAQQQARFSDAIDHSLSAVNEAHLAGDVEFEAALETHLASLYSKQGDIREAWRHLGVALRGEARTNSLRRRYSIYGRAVMSALELRLPGAAVAFSEGLLERTDGWSNPLAHAIAHLKQAEALTQLGFAAGADRSLAEAGRLIPHVASARVREDLKAQEDLTAGMLAQTPAQGLTRLDRAVDHFSKSDNRVLLAPSLLARGHLHRRAADARRAEEDWSRGVSLIEDQRLDIRDAQLQISRIDRAWELFDELTGLVADQRPVEALEIAERSRARQLLSSLSRTQRIEPLRGTALHDWLPAGTDALVYATLPDRLLIWHLTTGAVRMSTVGVPRGVLEGQVAAFREELRQRRRNGAGAALAKTVLPPDLPSGRTLLLIPDGPLHLLPFAALRTESGPFLSEASTIVTGASLTTSRAVTAAGAGIPHRALLVGVSLGDPAKGLPPLPGVRREIDALSAVYPDATTLEEQNATPGAVLDGIARHTVVHFAGHAITDSVYPNRSRLVVAGPSGASALTSADIAAARLQRGALVVLGACDTANGQIFRGEGSLALARAFFAAGAGNVVAALWKLSDADGQRFLVDFHRKLSSGTSPAHALRATQQAWIQAGGAPSVWASFQVMGALPNGRPE